MALDLSARSARVGAHRPLGALDRPGDALAHLGPNWFASVMGTGIVANAALLLPRDVPGRLALALVAWILAAVLLLVLSLATAAHWRLHPATARAHLSDPAMAPFYGAPPMALLTVGAGALLAGRHLIGTDAAVVVAFTLWTLGTLAGLLSAVVVPYAMITQQRLELGDVLGSWLMPVVPPMVSAATGAALIAHLPAGQARLTLLLVCLALFGLSLLASLPVIVLLWARLLFHGVGPARTVPALFIVLGPLGQSITAANLLGTAAAGVVGHPYDDALKAFGLVYGVPVLGFALLWLALAAALTLRTARTGLPFSLAWWSFTFPVGTVVTGTSELAARTGADALAYLALALFAALVLAWLTALARTVRGAVSGRLLSASPSPSVP